MELMPSAPSGNVHGFVDKLHSDTPLPSEASGQRSHKLPIAITCHRHSDLQNARCMSHPVITVIAHRTPHCVPVKHSEGTAGFIVTEESFLCPDEDIPTPTKPSEIKKVAIESRASPASWKPSVLRS